MTSEAPWPPPVGGLLPRAGEAYTVPEKLAWILGEDGHGREWARVFRIDASDANRLWEAIAHAVLSAPITAVRDVRPHGISCEVRIPLTLNMRSANILTAWHYAHPRDAPRLVTAHPKP